LRRISHCPLAKLLGTTLVAGTLTSCSTSTPVTPKPGEGSVIAFVQDAPICDAISTALTISGLSLTPTSGGNPVGYIATTPSFAPSIRINLQQLRDFTSILYISNVAAGSYNQAIYSVELATIGTYVPTLIPPVKNLTTVLTISKPIYTLDPPLQITPGQANVILVDFDVLRMLQVDSSGQLTGSVTPVISTTQLTSTATNGFGELSDIWGFVRSVVPVLPQSTSVNPAYTGSFLMQLWSPSTSGAPAVNVYLTAKTNLVGFTDLNHLLTDSYVEVDANVDSQGNLAAKTVEVQAVEDPFPRQSTQLPSTAFIGPIISITTDSEGNPTQLSLWVRDAEPDNPSSITMDTLFKVDLTSNPTYQASALGPNFANLGFGPLNLAVGQELVVHGTYVTSPTSTTGGVSTALPTVITPSAIYLKLQSIQGSLGPMIQIGSDNLTGAFVLNPCCSLLQGVPIYVLTNNQTNFLNATGLADLTQQSPLLVKGMSYYEPQASVINGVPVPAGTMVLQAQQVHVLQQ